MMDGRLLFLVLLSTVASLVSSELYHIVPRKSLHLCKEYSQHKCTPLAELPKVNDESEDDTFTLIFSPGKHSLMDYISVTSISNVTLVGSETQPPLIYYEGSSGFILHNVSILSIANFIMSRLGQTVLHISTADNIIVENCKIFENVSERQQQLKSAVYITTSKMVSITKCHFESNRIVHVSSASPHIRGGVLYIDNVHNVSVMENSFINNNLNVSGESSTLNGGVIYLKNITTMTLSNCFMSNNSAVSYGCDVRGGALFSLKTHQLQIVNSTFERNIAQSNRSTSCEASGGAIYTESDLIITSGCRYVGNVADRGGSIYLQKGSLSSSDNLYKNNFAYSDGGAIYTQGNSASTSNDNYTTNRAQYGAAIIAYVSSMTSTNNHFIGNTVSTNGGAISVNFVNSTAGVYNSSYNHFFNNTAGKNGGAAYVNFTEGRDGLYSSLYNNYTDNTAGLHDGGAVYVNFTDSTTGNHTSSYNAFTNNSAKRYGGAIYVSFRNSITGVHNSSYNNFTKNTANEDGGATNVVFDGSEHGFYNSLSNQFFNNTAQQYGGAIYVSFWNSTTGIHNSSRNIFANNTNNCESSSRSYNSSHDQFTSNTDGQHGGAIFANFAKSIAGFYYSSYDRCTKNTAIEYGGAAFVNFHESRDGLYNSLYSNYSDNTAGLHGGAVYVNFWHSINGNHKSSYNVYSNNTANKSGGATDVIFEQSKGGFYINLYNQFFNNTAHWYGGAVYVSFWNSTTGIHNSSYNNFTNNIAHQHGGAVFVTLWKSTTGIHNSLCNTFINNTANKVGGAIMFYADDYLDNFTPMLFSMKDTFTSNTALWGGGVYVVGSHINVEMANFSNNQAKIMGAAICQINGTINLNDCVISDNRADEGGVIYINSATFISRVLKFSNNNGSLYVVNSQIEFGGWSTLANNIGNMGGAITSIQSIIKFLSTATVLIVGNRATHGGGISLSESQLNISCPVNISGNTAKVSGGGIYAYQSEILLESKGETLTISNNSATSAQGDGGGACLIASNLKVFPAKVKFNNNSGVQGGAIFLEQNSNIYVYNREAVSNNNILTVNFSNNTANYGGAVYISDNVAAGTLCERKSLYEDRQALSQTECFLQSLSLIDVFTETLLYYLNTTTNIIFKHNRAITAGNAVYGGLLDRCSLNSLVDRNLKFVSGLDYIKALTIFDGQEGTILTSTDLREHISSYAVQVCFCADNKTYNCSVMLKEVSVKRGGSFIVKLTAVDQIQNQVDSTIVTTFSSNSSIGHFKEGQTRRSIRSTCTELEYNVYSESPQLQIDLYADGPCGDKGISKRTLNINFLSCECPVGFQPSESTTECICDCDTKLDGNIANCSIKNESLQLVTNAWIGYVNESSNNTGFIIYTTCPFDYCLERPINSSLNIPNGADMQCASNRMNLLCGECEEGLSLVLGSSNCKLCTNKYLSLLLPFAILGIVLVALILIPNMTVATGTMNGLIFYANIIGATRSTFFSHQQTNPTMIFIAWLNLDLGIETCFYNGMTSYAKVLLQLVFPLYLIFLTIMIIVLCEYSQRFASLLGNKNPVATLSTLILLSYSKLLRTIIASLQYTFLDYPDGSREIVWLYNANVPYLQTSHIPRFIIASIVLAIGAVYTILLFFGQWLPRLSNRKLMRWIRHSKYNAFIDAYHAPFSPKHRYWVGLLLLTRIVHNLVISLRTEASTTLLSVGCITSTLAFLKLINTRTYKNWTLDTLENIFLIN